MANNYISIELRKQIYERDNFTCQYCGKVGTLIRRYGKPCVVENPNNVNMNTDCRSYNGLDVISFEIDHIVPVCYGGTSTLDNLKLACHKCNASKGYKLPGALWPAIG